MVLLVMLVTLALLVILVLLSNTLLKTLKRPKRPTLSPPPSHNEKVLGRHPNDGITRVRYLFSHQFCQR